MKLTENELYVVGKLIFQQLNIGLAGLAAYSYLNFIKFDRQAFWLTHK